LGFGVGLQVYEISPKKGGGAFPRHAIADGNGTTTTAALNLPREPGEHEDQRSPLGLCRASRVVVCTGRHPKPFKTEWATEKDGLLYLGSIGKEWVVNGVPLSLLRASPNHARARRRHL
jgi:hypothetical protein